ncbi:hypothetical protein [Antribacter gilvus]|uniref:hypothetical protein n=1 Tax=Antribacter gilvus TaxID=2304675 RepID=UPI000F76D8F9|nr:hypothetical protein [Antribacter gilvus]
MAAARRKSEGTGRPQGRPYLGERAQVATRLPKPQANALKARAAASGLSITDYIAAVLSEHLERNEGPVMLDISA